MPDGMRITDINLERLSDGQMSFSTLDYTNARSTTSMCNMCMSIVKTYVILDKSYLDGSYGDMYSTKRSCQTNV
jgi:hypothetical protein